MEPSAHPADRAHGHSASRRWLPRWIPRAAFEAALIVFGLLLAMALNEWREARHQQARLGQALALLVDELKFNQRSIESPDTLAHHRGLLARYRDLASKDDAAGEPIFESGVHVATLRDAAWRTLSAPENIARVPYEQIVVLADLYQEQERLERIHWSVVGWLLAPRPAEHSAAYMKALNRSVAIYLSDVVSTEERLLRRYADALRMLEGNPR